jgi:hypothetical protein
VSSVQKRATPPVTPDVIGYEVSMSRVPLHPSARQRSRSLH